MADTNVNATDPARSTPASDPNPYIFDSDRGDFSRTFAKVACEQSQRAQPSADPPASAPPANGSARPSGAVRQALGFAEGFGEGLWGGIKGAAQGVGDLATGAYHFATDPNARQKDLRTAGSALSQAGTAVLGAIRDPGKAASEVGDAALGAVNKLSNAYETAAAKGEAGEFLGNALGEGVAAVGGDLIPGGAEAEAAGALGDVGRASEALGDAGETVQATGKAADAAKAAEVTGAPPVPTSADIAAYRARIGVPDTFTVGVGRTDAPGLEGETFYGSSPMVRRQAGLPRQEPGPLSSPRQMGLLRNHAEQDIGNRFIEAVEKAGLRPSDLDGKTLTMRIDNPRGVCSTCLLGLSDPSADSGVLKQLSQRYPGLNIHVIVNAPGPHLTNPAEFTVRNGAFVR